MSLLNFLHDAYAHHLERAQRLAGSDADIARRMAVIRMLERDSRGNVVVPVLLVRNREAFARFCAAYSFTREHGRLPGAPEFVPPHMLHLFNRLHDAVQEERLLNRDERVAFLAEANAEFVGLPASFFGVEDTAPLPTPLCRDGQPAFDLAVA
jgi:hypothetical protein